MSFLDCINGNKVLTPSQKKQLANEYDVYLKKYKSTMGDADAAIAAASKYAQIKSDVLAKKKINTMKDVLAWKALDIDLDKTANTIKQLKSTSAFNRKLYGKSDVVYAVKQKLEDTYSKIFGIERRAHGALAEQIEKYRSKAAGLTQDVEGFKNVVRELLGTDTGNAASKADGLAIRQVFDYLHKHYEAAGGVLGKLENYFPQKHNSNLVGRVSFKEWADYIKSEIDINKMINPETGLAFSLKELDSVLPDIYNGIVTHGLDDVALQAKEGKLRHGKGGGVSMRHSSSRFFHFKDADAYLRYNARFGYGDDGLFDAMMGHISTMSRDIGLMQQFGAKPQNQIIRMVTKAEADGATPSNIETINGLYDTLAGRNSYNGNTPFWYNTTMALQNWLRSTLLGGAPVSAMSDSFFVGMAAKMNGIEPVKAMGQYFKQLNPLDDGDRRIARRMGFAASAASGHSLNGARFSAEADGKGITAWMAGFTNRASGLGFMTDAVRSSLPISAMGTLAEFKHSNMSFADLPIAMKEAFDRWNINEADYDNFIKSDLYIDEDSGADFVRPDMVAKLSVDSAKKLEDWLTDMSMVASNEPRLLTRAITTGAVWGGGRTGTKGRAIASSVMMFKSFGISVILNHTLPAIRRMGDASKHDRFANLGILLVGTTVMGAAALQAKDVVYGKTPREMNSGSFWMAALLQGGGAGIFGDFIFSDQSRFGNSLIETFAGPVAGTMADAVKVFKGNFDRSLEEGTETKFFADLYQMAERNIPMAKLWYTRLFLERFMLDHIESAIDPKYKTRMRRIENKMKKEKGQEFWWKPSK